jgi:hypothetical protein
MMAALVPTNNSTSTAATDNAGGLAMTKNNWGAKPRQEIGHSAPTASTLTRHTTALVTRAAIALFD